MLDVDIDAESGFTDLDRSDWYYTAAAAAEREGIIHGFEDGTFRGEMDIPKDQLVVAAANTLMKRMNYKAPPDVDAELTRYLDRTELAAWSEGGIALATRSNVMLYRTDALFAPASVMTRGDAAIMLYRVFMKVW
jgi:hypothetical protein